MKQAGVAGILAIVCSVLLGCYGTIEVVSDPGCELTDAEAVAAGISSLAIRFYGDETESSVTQDELNGYCGTSIAWDSTQFAVIDTGGNVITSPY